jgi:hypothetical protein
MENTNRGEYIISERTDQQALKKQSMDLSFHLLYPSCNEMVGGNRIASSCGGSRKENNPFLIFEIQNCVDRAISPAVSGSSALCTAK